MWDCEKLEVAPPDEKKRVWQKKRKTFDQKKGERGIHFLALALSHHQSWATQKAQYKQKWNDVRRESSRRGGGNREEGGGLTASGKTDPHR